LVELLISEELANMWTNKSSPFLFLAHPFLGIPQQSMGKIAQSV
jgi:hypothetical protein